MDVFLSRLCVCVSVQRIGGVCVYVCVIRGARTIRAKKLYLG